MNNETLPWNNIVTNDKTFFFFFAFVPQRSRFATHNLSCWTIWQEQIIHFNEMEGNLFGALKTYFTVS